MAFYADDIKPAGVEDLSDEGGLCLIDLHDDPNDCIDFQEHTIQDNEVPIKPDGGHSCHGYFHEVSEEMKFQSSANVNIAKGNKHKSPVILDDLRKAACHGNLMQVENFIINGVPVDTSLRAGWTALMYAAFNARATVLEFLLERGANANFSKASYMYTPLLAAASSIQKKECVTSCITILLKRGANPNYHERSHMTPLMLVSKSGNVDAVDRLLEFGAQIDRQDNRGWTALCYAADQGFRNVVECLLNAAADINIRCSQGTARDVAMSKGHVELAELIAMMDGNAFQNCDRPLHKHLCLSPDTRSNENQHLASGKKMSSNHGEQSDELDLFLCGLGLGHLAPYFQQHEVNFPTLLCLSEEGLIKIGIDKYGWRCKILGALHEIHKKKWEPGSLGAPNKNILSLNDSIALIKNVCKHLAYIESSMTYLTDNWKTHGTLLDHHQDPSYWKKLEIESKEAIDNTKRLFEGLKKVRDDIKEVTWLEMSVPADMIDEGNCASGIGRKLKGLFAVSAVAASIILLCRVGIFHRI